MSTAANRRAAYHLVGTFITDEVKHSDSYRATTGVQHFPDEVRAELLRIRDAMLAASAVVDEPGVEEHVSGDGKAAPK